MQSPSWLLIDFVNKYADYPDFKIGPAVLDHVDEVARRFRLCTGTRHPTRILLHAPKLIPFLEDPRGCWFKSLLARELGLKVGFEVLWSGKDEVKDHIVRFGLPSDIFGLTKLVVISIDGDKRGC